MRRWTGCFRRPRDEGVITAHRADEAVADLLDLRVNRYHHLVLLPRIWHLGQNLSAYDSAYIVLAEELGGTLVTRNRRLAVAKGHAATVELFNSKIALPARDRRRATVSHAGTRTPLPFFSPELPRISRLTVIATATQKDRHRTRRVRHDCGIRFLTCESRGKPVSHRRRDAVSADWCSSIPPAGPDL